MSSGGAARDPQDALRQWFEQAPGAIALLRGPDHVFELVNRAYQAFVGPRELVGKAVLEALPEYRDQGIVDTLDRVFRTGEPYVARRERVMVRRDPGAPPQEVFVDLVYQPVFEPDGRVSGIFAQGNDVTETQHLLTALREADARKDEFLAMLAHELRNPLAPLTNALRLIERTEPLGEAGRAALAMAERQRGQLARLVDDLLEVTRITRGLIELRPEPITVGAAVLAAVEARLPGLEQRRQTITVSLPESPVRIVADPARIAQVLDNLLANAKKFTSEGGAIRVEVEALPETVEIRVSDNGIGIAPEGLPRLFEPFTQLNATFDRAVGGLGIGLALVKRLVEMHGGTVRADSAGLGRGSTFAVRLPRGPRP